MTGAFQTSREIFENPIWKNIVDFRLFFLIYGQAVFAEEGYRVSEDLFLERGQWCRSIRKLQEDLTYVENRQIKTYSTSVISRCITRLVQSQRICTKTHELGTVFTVLNYEQYQGFANYKKDNLERNLEQSGNSGGTVGEQSGNNNKNVKKDKNVNNDNKKNNSYSEDFENFWTAYPNKVGKKDAWTVWQRLLKDKKEPQVIIECAMNYASSCKANKTELKFIKHPKTFLNEERYLDYKSPVIIYNGGESNGRIETGDTGDASPPKPGSLTARFAHGG